MKRQQVLYQRVLGGGGGAERAEGFLGVGDRELQ